MNLGITKTKAGLSIYIDDYRVYGINTTGHNNAKLLLDIDIEEPEVLQLIAKNIEITLKRRIKNETNKWKIKSFTRTNF